jgi:hypothetical protein
MKERRNKGPECDDQEPLEIGDVCAPLGKISKINDDGNQHRRIDI